MNIRIDMDLESYALFSEIEENENQDFPYRILQKSISPINFNKTTANSVYGLTGSLSSLYSSVNSITVNTSNIKNAISIKTSNSGGN